MLRLGGGGDARQRARRRRRVRRDRQHRLDRGLRRPDRPDRLRRLQGRRGRDDAAGGARPRERARPRLHDRAGPVRHAAARGAAARRRARRWASRSRTRTASARRRSTRRWPPTSSRTRCSTARSSGSTARSAWPRARALDPSGRPIGSAAHAGSGTFAKVGDRDRVVAAGRALFLSGDGAASPALQGGPGQGDRPLSQGRPRDKAKGARRAPGRCCAPSPPGRPADPLPSLLPLAPPPSSPPPLRSLLRKQPGDRGELAARVIKARASERRLGGSRRRTARPTRRSGAAGRSPPLSRCRARRAEVGAGALARTRSTSPEHHGALRERGRHRPRGRSRHRHDRPAHRRRVDARDGQFERQMSRGPDAGGIGRGPVGYTQLDRSVVARGAGRDRAHQRGDRRRLRRQRADGVGRRRRHWSWSTRTAVPPPRPARSRATPWPAARTTRT